MWGPKRDWGSAALYTIGHLYDARKNFQKDPAKYTEFSVDKFWLMGYVIPPFQRNPDYDPSKPEIGALMVNTIDGEDAERVIQPTWSLQQMIRFVESAAQGMGLGTWTFHTTENSDLKRPDGSIYFPRDQWLIDGQQRLWALNTFFDGKFPVFGKFWDEVDTARQRKFLNSTPFTAYQMKDRSELELREYYDLSNFSGTAHREEERALPGFKL